LQKNKLTETGGRDTQSFTDRKGAATTNSAEFSHKYWQHHSVKINRSNACLHVLTLNCRTLTNDEKSKPTDSTKNDNELQYSVLTTKLSICADPTNAKCSVCLS